jgi:hypothetical protein
MLGSSKIRDEIEAVVEFVRFLEIIIEVKEKGVLFTTCVDRAVFREAKAPIKRIGSLDPALDRRKSKI